MRHVALVALAGLAALATPSAVLADPVTLASPAGLEGTNVAVAPDGTAHVAWGEADASGARRVRYCRLPRGAGQCSASAEFPASGPLFSRPSVLLTDGGASFGGQIGVGDGAADEYVLGPGNAIDGASAPDASGTADAQYWDFPLDGSGNGGDRASIVNSQHTAPHAFIETWNT